MSKPEFEQFGITKEQYDSIYARKKIIRNWAFGICSAVGIITGIIVGIYLSKGLYETVVFVLFFGCFLGSLFGAVTTITTVKLYVLSLYIFSPVYKGCRQYRAAKAKADLKSEKHIW